jgi:peptidyl-prolyl cis-trans isomerase NIMA-interacting 1
MVGLRVLWPLCLGLTLSVGCNDLTAPNEERVTPLPEPPAAPPAANRPAVEAASAQAPPAASPPSPEVAHVLIAYKGAKNAPAKATRTKEQARKLAEELAKRAPKEDFAALAKRSSDDAATASKGGSMGSLSASAAPRPLYEAATALAPGAVSSVVETDEGFHVLKRPGSPAAAPTPHNNGTKPNTTAPKPPPPPTRPQTPPRPTNPPPRPKAPGSH